MSATRREFLKTCAVAGAFLTPAATLRQVDGRVVGTVPLGPAERRPPPFETLLSSGLNARLFTDLSTLTPGTLVTANERFFVRTACPHALPPSGRWSLTLSGRVARPQTIPLRALRDLVRPIGTCLLECAGNADPTNFGLISAARWDGIPLAPLLDRARPLGGARHVLVSGIDDAEPTPTSIPGASWIFSRDDLERAGAFLATRMNHAPLPRDHGFPARLIVPGWYGCTCIKWVTRIEFVGQDAAATAQMREFAGRTHQDASAALARDFAPAVIDHAATVVRVEKWRTRAGVRYRVVGILWGGSRPTNALSIRFRREEPFVPVEECAQPPSTTTWSLWSHSWRPVATGAYHIALRITDPTLRTRRLDRGFYARDVYIDEV